MPLLWVHLVLAHAICVSCALFCIKYYRKKCYKQTREYECCVNRYVPCSNDETAVSNLLILLSAEFGLWSKLQSMGYVFHTIGVIQLEKETKRRK